MNRFDTHIRKTMFSLIITLITVTVFFVVVYLTYGIYYLSNDDTGMMKAFSGYGTGIPTQYHQYGSFTLGMICKLLYTLVPTWNWYSYGSILVVILSNTVIISSIFMNRNSAENVMRYVDFCLIFIFVIALSMYGISRISWTINAAFASVGGLMLLVCLPIEKKAGNIRYVAAIIFMFIGLLIRGASYKAVFPYAILVLLFRAGTRLRKEGRECVRYICIELVLLLIPLIGILLYNKVDTGFKSDVFQSDADSFEHYRGLYTDHPHIPFDGNEDFYKSLGWDEEFYTVARSWMFIDPRFNTENLKKIAEASNGMRTDERVSEQIYSLWDDFIEKTVENTMRTGMSIAVVVFLAVGLFMTLYKLIKKADWYDWLFLAFVQVLAIMEWLYLLYERGRFIDRAFYCATYPAMFIGMWIVVKKVSAIQDRKSVV